ncbi:hypothetical protein AGMMS49942_21910 [Spirochaetia bacterium]|nr:hypothetical protein AGMMS49942_21910 [Spirochaetia bacterium]
MARKRTLRYYLKKVPHNEEVFEDGSFEDAIEGYKKWKLEIADYYRPDKKLQKCYPEAYNILTTEEITDKEIEKLKEEYNNQVIIYSKKLSSAEYELE